MDKQKIIIAGSRNISARPEIVRAIDSSPFYIGEVVCGCARGVDMTARSIAEIMGFNITDFPADWDKYGKPAGYIRNKEMGEYADGLIAIWDLKSQWHPFND